MIFEGKKTAAIITMHNVPNYGSFLQTYATQRIFKSLGVDTYIIDYYPYLRSKRFYLFDHLGQKKNFLREIVFILFYLPSRLKLWNVFNKAQKKDLLLSRKKYISLEELKQNTPEASVYVSGGDQVWNWKCNRGIDPAYFLAFAKNKPKISFSSSIAEKSIPDNMMTEMFEYLKDYDFISVREIYSVSLLEQIGIRNSKVILDPTLILTIDEWNEYQKLSKLCIEQDEYVLLYILGRDKYAVDCAKTIATVNNYKVYKISWDGILYAGIDKYYKYIEPKDLLSLFKNASFIVTNSFHGICMSIEYKKQFIATAEKLNGRIESILSLFGLQNRFIKKGNFSTEKIGKIDYSKVDSIHQKLRNDAYNYLSKCVQ